MSTGRRFNRTVQNSLTTNCRTLENKLLAEVPGISLATARQITDTMTLREFLEKPIEEIAEIKIGTKGRKLGKRTAETILRLFNYSTKKKTHP